MSSKKQVSHARLIKRINGTLAVDTQKLLPEPDGSGKFYTVNRITNSRVENGIADLAAFGRSIGAGLKDDEELAP